MVSILYIVALFALLYFLFIRPQQKRQKEHQKMINELQVHDEISTIGGIIGTVVRIKEDTMVLRVAENVKMEIIKSAVGQVRKKTNEPDDKDDE
ncbi:MAG: preprotein translocase subunit YajC [Firmicutes bacterium]|nr:preprotein translocase subunit YajC [Bacillota bacterium]